MAADSKLILVGQVAGGFGVKGEVRVTAWTAEPMTLLKYGVLLRADGTPGLTLTSARPEKTAVVGRAREIATKEQADALRGLKLYLHRDKLPEPDEDEFYLTDLVGLEARDPEGVVLGSVRAVQNFGADLTSVVMSGHERAIWLFGATTLPEVSRTLLTVMK